MEPYAEIVRVSPEMATEWLWRNKRPRVVSNRIVDRLMETIKRNEWRPMDSPICFDYNGDVVDGLHRLLAISESGKTVTVVVVRGLEPGAHTVMDANA